MFFRFFISVIINLHKIIDRRCVLESSRQSDSNTRSQHMISWRNIEKKSLLIILIPTPILLYVRMKSWVTFVRRCFRDVNLQGILCLTGGSLALWLRASDSIGRPGFDPRPGRCVVSLSKRHLLSKSTGNTQE